MPAARNPAPDESAFAELYGAQFDFVWRSIRAMGVDAVQAEDLVQDVFVAARRKLPSLDRDRSARAWLFGIARNEVRAHRRKAARYAQRIGRIEPPKAPAQPDEVLCARRAASLVESFLADLDEASRLSFVLADLEGLPGREAAAALEIPLQTHYSRVHAARRRLAAFATVLEGTEPRHGTDG